MTIIYRSTLGDEKYCDVEGLQCLTDNFGEV